MKREVKSRPLRTVWALYFLFTVGWVGFLTGYLFSIPLCTLGRWYEPLDRLGGKVLAFGVWMAMHLQPWFDADVELALPPIPPGKPGFITMSNHRSHLDMFFLLWYLPSVRAIAKQGLFRVPFLGIMLRVMRMIGINKGDPKSYFSAMDVAAAGVAAGDKVHVFPEMTRCPEGYQGTGDFHLMPFRMAIRTGAPIVPIVFIGTDRVWPKDRFAIRTGQKIQVKALAPVDVAKFTSADALRAEVKARINSELAAHAS